MSLRPRRWWGLGRVAVHIALSTYTHSFAASLRKLIDPELRNSYQSIKLIAIFYKKNCALICVFFKNWYYYYLEKNISP